MVRPVTLLVALLAAAAVGAVAATAGAGDEAVQPRDADGRFRNLDAFEGRGFGAFLRWKIWDRLLGRNTRAPATAAVPRVEPDLERLRTPPGPGEGARITWIGHATFLVQLEGKSFLTDPVLTDSLPGFIRRNVPPAIPFEKLPPIDAVLVSHNHYDHLDLPTLRRIGAPVVAGLGTRKLLSSERLLCTELGWWQSTRVGGVTVTFVPAQHFSQRGLGDRNEALWGGFVVEGGSAALYHAGDTAAFSGFREIGRHFALDAALLPIGAYDPRWFMAPVHLDPEQALQAFEELGARTFFAMHWGTFKLSDEPLDEPPHRVEAERLRRGLPPDRVRVLAIGETAEVQREPVATPPPEPSPEAASASAPGPVDAAARSAEPRPGPEAVPDR